MNINYRVKNSKGETCGFIADDNRYYGYNDVLNRIRFFSNVKAYNNVIKSIKDSLPVISKKNVNMQIYNMMIKERSLVRDIQKEFEKWKEERNEYVLYLMGARQVGKTTELLKFAYKNYEQIIYINLSDDSIASKFEDCLSNRYLKFGMLEYCEKMGLEEFMDSGNTILIVDEIQESVNAYNSIRRLQYELDCNVAVIGSYLGKILNSKYFKPVGNIWRMELLPLSFPEFCNSFGYKKLLYKIDIHGNDTKENYYNLYKLYEDYIQIGGYPEVVSTYKKQIYPMILAGKQNISLEPCMKVIGQIVDTFTEESASYFSESAGNVKDIFDNVYKHVFKGMMLEKKETSSNDTEIITNLVKESTNEHVCRAEVNKVFAWLSYSGIIGSCDLYNKGNILELLPNTRFYFMDCGIANYTSQKTLLKSDTVREILTENFVYTELYSLYKTEEVKGNKPCCSVYNNYELDFMVIDKNDERYGIEIKASDANNSASLIVYLRDRKTCKGYLAGKTRGGKRADIYSIPIYAVGCRFPYN